MLKKFSNQAIGIEGASLKIPPKITALGTQNAESWMLRILTFGKEGFFLKKKKACAGNCATCWKKKILQKPTAEGVAHA